jgi:zinc-ribbon domain
MIQTANAEEMQASPLTHASAGPAAQAEAESPVRTSATSPESSGLALDAAEETRADRLRDELAVLESRFAAVGGQLAEALREFHAETVPNGSLGSDLTVLQADFGIFRARVAELAGSLSVPAEAITGPSLRLDALRQTLSEIGDAERRRAFHELRDRAAGELKRALSLVYHNNPGFAPLEECKDGVRKLLAEITASEWPDVNPECRPLAERRHAVSRLLDLVRHGAELSDSDCEAAVDAVAASFGKLLAIAAVRGRLGLEDGASAPASAVERCPSCGAELDPGARFCGECGMKID